MSKFASSRLSAVCLALILLLSGCRQRIIELPDGISADPGEESDQNLATEPAETVSGASVEALHDQNGSVPSPGESLDAGESFSTSGDNVSKPDSPDDSSGQEALSDADGSATVGLIIGEYGEILEEGLGSLYECQLGYVYFELTEDYRTVDNQSDIHSLITGAGGYNVAEKKHDATVDDGWIIRKNPTLIVKCVGSDVLGGSVSDTKAAKNEYERLISRSGWNGIGAVIEGRVMLVSEELLKDDAGRFMLKILLKSGMYPEL